MIKQTLRLVLIVDPDPISSFVTKLMCLSTHLCLNTLVVNSKAEAIRYLKERESATHSVPDAILVSCDALKSENQSCEECIEDFLPYISETKIILVCGSENETKIQRTELSFSKIQLFSKPLKENDFCEIKKSFQHLEVA